MTEIAVVHQNQVIICTSSQFLGHSECRKDINEKQIQFYESFSPFDILIIGLGGRFGYIERTVNINDIPQREVYLKYLSSRLNHGYETLTLNEGSIYLGVITSVGGIR